MPDIYNALDSMSPLPSLELHHTSIILFGPFCLTNQPEFFHFNFEKLIKQGVGIRDITCAVLIIFVVGA